MFKDIKIIDKNGGIEPEHTIGWKFWVGENSYANVISDQRPTGKYKIVSGYDEDDREYYEEKREIYKTVPITMEEQIALMENMVETMKYLITKKGELSSHDRRDHQ